MSLAINQGEADRAYDLWINAEPHPTPQQMADALNSARPHGSEKATPGDAVMIARSEWTRRRAAAGWS